MRSLLQFSFLFVVALLNWQSAQSKNYFPPDTTLNENEIFLTADQMPIYKGCENEANPKECTYQKIKEFLAKNLIYPDTAKKAKIGGRVTITFVIEKDGRVTNIATMGRYIGYSLEEEGLRVVTLMGQVDGPWIPGKKNGRPVRIRYNLPIVFKITKQ